ncbi:ATPase family protein associated with various cellular activities (AAA) [Kineococcus xinjiangensis]|uniref:ATPase family protein associated with various cellular activities (AAA) n=1 Tax=Kineococcus xinjiangensis TaxID=512762 RepID=A0A2S6II89_9ACTN|nr:ATP-binding protein [Kineococcus xinjiangensis]PPK93890.1 ATPase family protein associated with various cellular activities (AAA) [Kineococcus xinjiangensis]
MATAAQVKALVESHGQGDEARFYSVALQIADSAAKSGRVRFSEDLRNLVETGRVAGAGGRYLSPTSRAVQVAQPRGELAQVLTVGYPTAHLTDMALSLEVLRRIQRILAEQRRQETLRTHGFQPMRKVLLSGPPGTGKTMTADVVAGELNLPSFSIRLDNLVDLTVDEAVTKLRLVFDLVSQTRGVFLFDNLDALVGQPGQDDASAAAGSGGHLIRSFLGFLEEDESPSVLVVTTNRTQLLDRGLLRRFDVLIHYVLPTTGVIHDLIQRRLRKFDLTAVEWPRVASTAGGLSHEEVAAAAELAAKQSVLDGKDQVETSALLNALRERRELLKISS